MGEQRKNADELLKVINKQSSMIGMGKLKIFLGMCPGVGKTYSMLSAAHEISKKGFNIVIGIVETHSRVETQNLVAGLKQVPLVEVSYRGATLKEMDLDALLTLKPDYVLVDELAHTNAPGSRHRKRWQDVQELLANGINVLTTINIQHIESKASLVEEISGVKISETVPDSIFEIADEIRLIDISATDLLTRLSDGKVYLGERAVKAKEGFFKPEILLALREISLRYTAEKVDSALQSELTLKGVSQVWNTREKFLVAISHSPTSVHLIRATKNLAVSADAPWIALHVDSGVELEEADRKQLKQNIELAKELGSEFISLTDLDLVSAIEKVCLDRQVTQIIVGRPQRGISIKNFFGKDFIDRLLCSTQKVDIHILRYTPGDIKWNPQETILQYLKNSHWTEYYHAFLYSIIASVVAYSLSAFISYKTLGFFFLIALLGQATFVSLGPVVFSALIVSLSWNYFFIPPKFTFHIQSSDDFMMVASFFIAALVSGSLTTRLRLRDKLIREREGRTFKMYQFTKLISQKNEIVEALELVADNLKGEVFGDISFYFKDDFPLSRDHRLSIGEDKKEIAVADWTFNNNKDAGWGTSTLSGAGVRTFPISYEGKVQGVLLLRPYRRGNHLSIDDENFIEGVTGQLAHFIVRRRLALQNQEAKFVEVSEKLHRVLLNSVSHEMKTPLTTILGISKSLQESSPTINPELSRELLTDLITSTKRLDRVVNNLLEMSRLESNALKVQKEWFRFEDLKFEFERVEGLFPQVKWNNLEVLMEADFQLTLLVIDNLISNAERHGAKDKPIKVSAIDGDHQFEIQVVNEGLPIAEELGNSIFEKFKQGTHSKSGGVGLGLSIVKSLVELQGGEVSYKNLPGQVMFVVQMPKNKVPLSLVEALKESTDE